VIVLMSLRAFVAKQSPVKRDALIEEFHPFKRKLLRRVSTPHCTKRQCGASVRPVDTAYSTLLAMTSEN
jgi:hypothetical protein